MRAQSSSLPRGWWSFSLSMRAANAGARRGAHGEATEVVDSARTETLALGALPGGWLRRFLLGAQWRELWTTPIEVPI